MINLIDFDNEGHFSDINNNSTDASRLLFADDINFNSNTCDIIIHHNCPKTHSKRK